MLKKKKKKSNLKGLEENTSLQRSLLSKPGSLLNKVGQFMLLKLIKIYMSLCSS